MNNARQTYVEPLPKPPTRGPKWRVRCDCGWAKKEYVAERAAQRGQAHVCRDLRSAARFWSRVDVRGSDECWPWMGTRVDGYGQATFGGRRQPAHRVAWELTCGAIRDGLWALHHCDNRPCCNPSHLFLGTNADNVADKMAKGREARGERLAAAIRPSIQRGDAHYSRRHPEAMKHGEDVSSARLTWGQVAEARSLRACGLTQRAIAAKFGVARSTISYVVRGITYPPQRAPQQIQQSN